MRNKKFAFTLAEVLITLGVLGVVAAATMPTLISNYQKKVWAKSLAKSYSTATQACKMALAQNNTSYINLTDLYKSMGHFSYAENAINKYFKNAKVSGYPTRDYTYLGYNNAQLPAQHIWNYTIDFPSSSLYIGDPSNNRYFGYYRPVLRFGVDVNGHSKGPNKIGADLFAFTLDYDCTLYPAEGSCSNHDGGLDAAYGCFRRVMNDGWEIKYDPQRGTGLGGGDY